MLGRNFPQHLDERQQCVFSEKQQLLSKGTSCFDINMMKVSFQCEKLYMTIIFNSRGKTIVQSFLFQMIISTKDREDWKNHENYVYTCGYMNY